MGRRGHVGRHQVETAVVVQVSRCGAHREPGGVRQRSGKDVLEGPVPAIAVELVRVGEVVRDVKIGVSIRVVVPPRHVQSVVWSLDAGVLAYIHKVQPSRFHEEVLEEVIELPGLGELLLAPGQVDDADQFAVWFLHGVGSGTSLVLNLGVADRFTPVGDQIGVQVAVEVIVGKRHFDVRANEA